MDVYIWSIIIGGCLVTLGPRVLPITFLSKVTLNESMLEFLACLPLAILAALIAGELLLAGQKPALAGNELKLLAALPTVFVAFFRNDLLLTVVTGMASLAALRFFLG